MASVLIHLSVSRRLRRGRHPAWRSRGRDPGLWRGPEDAADQTRIRLYDLELQRRHGPGKHRHAGTDGPQSQLTLRIQGVRERNRRIPDPTKTDARGQRGLQFNRGVRGRNHQHWRDQAASSGWVRTPSPPPPLRCVHGPRLSRTARIRNRLFRYFATGGFVKKKKKKKSPSKSIRVHRLSGSFI